MGFEKRHILVSGMIAGDPHQGGATWAVLQYVLGFRRLGHTVTFVEPVQEAALSPRGAPLAKTNNAAYFREVVREFGLEEDAVLFRPDTHETIGVSFEELCRTAAKT